jgi:subtilisin-like proprotein convertase family protein
VDWYNDEVLINSPGIYTAAAGDATRVYKYETPRPNEYFLVENRTAMGQDASLPSSGLAVYHCDTLGSNEWEEGTRERHYQVALVQADGHLDLEHGGNRGDTTDLYGAVTGVAVSDTTTPNSRMWDGTGSGLVLSAISPPGTDINFRVGAAGTPDGASMTAETVADTLIPDADPAGARSSLQISAPSVLSALRVELDILHPFIGDLTVRLMGPDGTSIVLHDREGGGADDLHAVYDSAQSGSSLADLLGHPAAGTWTLHIVDNVRRDTGRLNRWRIDVRTRTEDRPLRAESTPGTAIPDEDQRGIEDRIEIDEEGTLRSIRIEVEIQHTFVGDLRVDLVPPSGPVVALHERTGGARDDLFEAYDATTTPTLASLLGGPVKGLWALRVRDTARGDTGTLRRWAIELQR